jgi:hypothetical protein
VSAPSAAARKATVRVIPPPKRTTGNPAMPNSTVCRIGGKCRNFSWAETADIATTSHSAHSAILGTWGTDLSILLSVQVLIPQVQAAATTYFHSLYCITLRFPDPWNAFYIVAAPYGPRHHNGC